MKQSQASKKSNRKPVKASQAAGAAPADAAAAVFSPSSDEVAYRAFLNYQNHGAADGQDVKDWLVAEAELIAEHQAVIGAGGHIANVGVHGKSVSLHLETLWSKNITITTRLVDAVTTPLLMKTVVSGELQPRQLITHRFPLSEIMSAYDTFGNAARERALKVIVTNE